ncbi:nucleoside triphosphate pyrophosphohydrolase family protein [Burkholderia alba]|uniref:nucleoside triphosphate pyrophosphohydrolase family protein n=1 Tax=Burkholderia alba TaxID=2683677 RepID=UPI002B051A30|nr:nucleoside triphosphate pyrophosphohydrolase family protein [Burkholderia alba]
MSRKSLVDNADCASDITSEADFSTFSAYQAMVERTNERPSRAVSLMGLVGEVGDLHSMMKKLLLQKGNPLFRTELREEFGDLLWYLTSLASLYEIPLEEIAKANAEKAESLYSKGSVNIFDFEFPDDERLPRRFVVNFYEKPLEPSLYVKVSVGGVVIGDALTDNSHEDDGYRYHDVFHLAYAAVLGWSPVCRALLKRKRKSKPKIDEVEDGARAAVIEEAISVLIFNQAEERTWYSDRSSVDISLLKTIRRMATGLEVRACTAKQWQDAIFQGYAAFRELKKNRGGDVVVDLDKQKLTYRTTSSGKGRRT